MGENVEERLTALEIGQAEIKAPFIYPFLIFLVYKLAYLLLIVKHLLLLLALISISF